MIFRITLTHYKRYTKGEWPKVVPKSLIHQDQNIIQLFS